MLAGIVFVIPSLASQQTSASQGTSQGTGTQGESKTFDLPCGEHCDHAMGGSKTVKHPVRNQMVRHRANPGSMCGAL